MALRWKKNPKPIGLMSIGAGPRGSKLRDGEVEYASIAPCWENHKVVGWFWVALSSGGIPYKNTCDEPVATEDDAKRDAMAYVKKHLVAAAPADAAEKKQKA
jgi:hypothetical protein